MPCFTHTAKGVDGLWKRSTSTMSILRKKRTIVGGKGSNHEGFSRVDDVNFTCSEGTIFEREDEDCQDLSRVDVFQF